MKDNDQIPIAYNEGKVEFYNCVIHVSSHVLIPRPETEILLDIALKQAFPKESYKVTDLCCGSGCLGLGWKKHRPQDEVVLSDISLKALEIAEKNAIVNKLDVSFLSGDFSIPAETEILLCNPPYIKTEEIQELDASVRDYEPHLALDGGQDGVYFYRVLARKLCRTECQPLFLFLEIGATQAKCVATLFDISGYDVKIQKDWAGHDRFCLLQKRHP